MVAALIWGVGEGKAGGEIAKRGIIWSVPKWKAIPSMRQGRDEAP